MIAYLEGIVLEKNIDHIILKTGGIGYIIFLTKNTNNSIKQGEESSLFIYYHQTDRSTDLFGFITSLDMDAFKLLLKVSGIGPKSALTILDKVDSKKLLQSIANGDSQGLKEEGLTAKQAVKIVSDLSKKVEGLLSSHKEDLDTEKTSLSDELKQVLKDLGYTPQQFDKISSKIDTSQGLEEQVRQALSYLS